MTSGPNLSLQNLLDEQFEYNDRFNQRVNEPEDLNNLRQDPIGRDKFGRLYWFFLVGTVCSLYWATAPDKVAFEDNQIIFVKPAVTT